MEHKRISLLFIATALITLIMGVLFGMIGGLQYIVPEFLKEEFLKAKVKEHLTCVQKL